MRLNDDKIKRDMMGEIAIEECPRIFRSMAENIIKMLNVNKPPSYNTMAELDKRLTLMYWDVFDNINLHIAHLGDFEEWYVAAATSPDHISRARRWLVENRYLIIKTDVAERAQGAGDQWKGAVKQR